MWRDNSDGIGAHAARGFPPLVPLHSAIAWRDAQADFLLDDGLESLIAQNRRSMLSFLLLVLVWIVKLMPPTVSIGRGVLFFRE